MELLEAVKKVETDLKKIKQMAITNMDPSIKFNQKTLIKDKFKGIAQSEALILVMRETSGCMNINDIASDLFDLKGVSPSERTRHMKALQSIITRTPEVVSAESQRGYWKLKNI